MHVVKWKSGGNHIRRSCSCKNNLSQTVLSEVGLMVANKLTVISDQITSQTYVKVVLSSDKKK